MAIIENKKRIAILAGCAVFGFWNSLTMSGGISAGVGGAIGATAIGYVLLEHRSTPDEPSADNA